MMAGAWRIPDNVTWKALPSGTLVLVNLLEGSYYQLNETGSLAWQDLVAGKGVDDIAAHVSGEFDCSPEQARADIHDLLDFFQKESLVCAQAAS